MYGTFTLTGKHQLIDGTPHAGTARIVCNTVLRDATGDVILAGPLTVPLDGAGSWSKVLPAADVALQPQPHGFTVSMRLRGGQVAPVTFAAPAPGTVLALADIASTVLPPVLVPAGATVQDVAAASASAATLVTAEAVTARAAEAKAVPHWAPLTAYTAGQQVVSPGNDVVSANVTHTSAAAYATDVAKWLISSTYGLKVPTNKMDGQNLKNHRRPTLVIDKMFPNIRHDHQILWVDETLKIAYAIGQDWHVRKTTWATAGDEALTFATTAYVTTPAAKAWGGTGVMFREPVSGNVFLGETDSADATTGVKLLRSTDDVHSFATVWTSPGFGKRFLGPQSIAQDAVTHYLYLVEYTVDVTATTADIWRSTDNGATWAVWRSYPRHDSNPNTIRHWHSVRWDPISARVYFMAGDGNADAGIYRVNAGGTDIEPVIKNSQISAQFGQVAPARCVDLMFFPNYLAWGCDGSGGVCYVTRMARDQIGQANPVVEQVAAINSTGWYAQNASSDGSVWVVSASTEPLGGALTNDAATHLYAVTNDGAQVDEVASAAMDGNLVGFSCLSGLAFGAGQGDSFWMRAHNYQGLGKRNLSAFQFRAKIVYGTVPVISKPEGIQRLEYVRESRNWLATMAASDTLTFAHTRCPRSTSKLNILNWGAKVLTGTGVVKIQAWNVTAATLVAEYTLGNWRYDSYADASQYYGSYPAASGNQIEFRLVETGGIAGATVSGFIEFGWAY